MNERKKEKKKQGKKTNFDLCRSLPLSSKMSTGRLIFIERNSNYSIKKKQFLWNKKTTVLFCFFILQLETQWLPGGVPFIRDGSSVNHSSTWTTIGLRGLLALLGEKKMSEGLQLIYVWTHEWSWTQQEVLKFRKTFKLKTSPRDWCVFSSLHRITVFPRWILVHFSKQFVQTAKHGGIPAYKTQFLSQNQISTPCFTVLND